MGRPTALLATCAAGIAAGSRTTYLLDAGWKFEQTNSRAPTPGQACADPGCQPATADGMWRSVDLPHDFIVEGNFSQSAAGDQGYLPYTDAWYRRHITIPAAAAGSTMWIDFDGIQTRSYVFLNGHALGSSQSGYTGGRYFLPASAILPGADNVLAVYADGGHPTGWW